MVEESKTELFIFALGVMAFMFLLILIAAGWESLKQYGAEQDRIAREKIIDTKEEVLRSIGK